MGDDNRVFGPPAFSVQKLPPPVTHQQVGESKNEQALAPIKGLATSAAAVVPALTMMNREGMIPGLARRGSSFGGGVHFERGQTGYRPVIGPFSFATFLAPAPIGIVQPELYQINPSYLHTTPLGRLPGPETTGIKASSVREAVFEAERAEREIARQVLRIGLFTVQPADTSHIPTADLIAMQGFLRTNANTQFLSPEAHRAINAELEFRAQRTLPLPSSSVDAIPSAISGPPVEGFPFGVNVADGSSVPQDFDPANGKAKQNADDAEGINRDLVQIKFDP